MGSYVLLEGIFLTQGSNVHLLHCRQILHHVSRKEGLRIWGRVIYLGVREPEEAGVRKKEGLRSKEEPII